MGWNNKEQRLTYEQRYRVQNRQRIRDNAKRWRDRNKQKLKEKNRLWRLNNLEEIREKDRMKAKLWRQNNNEKNQENIRNRKLKTRQAIWEYKEQRGCSQCNEKDPRCLDFHHRNPKEKSYHISLGLSNKLSLETLMKEIAKCDLLCRNCHVKLNPRIWIKPKKEED